MSLYNMIYGFNPACILLLPMLGRKHEEYPRFRDCWLTEDGNIAVYTRVGGGNRNQGYNEEVLYADPNFIRTFDDEYDNTYGVYEFRVPEKWKADFDHITNSRFHEVSQEYVDLVKSHHPFLAERGIIDKLFCRKMNS